MNRREFVRLAGAASVGFAVSCRSRSGVSRTFPSFVNGEMHGNLNRAQDTINHVGVHRVSPRSAEARLVDGQRRFGAAWGWLASHPSFPGGQLWVLGLCYGRLIEVARNPNHAQPHQINWPTVHHEFVHHWLMTNGHGPYHFPVYDRHVEGWANARRVTGQAAELEEGPIHLTVMVDRRPVAVDGWITPPDDVIPLDIEPRPLRWPRA